MSSLSTELPKRLENVLEASRVIGDPGVCAEYTVDELVPSAVVKPACAEEVAEIVRFAAMERLSIIPCGNRTKLGIGMPPARYDIGLDMTGLHQIAHYDPADLTLSVDAGTPFNDVAAPLYKQKQFLPLAVPFYFESTIGGIVASGVDSALRHSYGTVRDFLLGAEFVDGKGTRCKSGGRVVKNVTGYDLHKLLVGSLGSLGVITRLNFRTFPVAPESRGFVASFADLAGALELRQAIAASPLAPASVEIVSPELMQLFLEASDRDVSEAETSGESPGPGLRGLFPDRAWHVCVSVEGTLEVCERSTRELREFAARAAAANILSFEAQDSRSGDLWHYISQAVPLCLEGSPVACVFKIAQLPSRLAAIIEGARMVATRGAVSRAVLARASGVVYFALIPQGENADSGDEQQPDSPEIVARLSALAEEVFALSTREGALVTLPWCPRQIKRGVNVCGAPRADAKLLRGVKAAFDPHNVLSPGRVL